MVAGLRRPGAGRPGRASGCQQHRYPVGRRSPGRGEGAGPQHGCRSIAAAGPGRGCEPPGRRRSHARHQARDLDHGRRQPVVRTRSVRPARPRQRGRPARCRCARRAIAKHPLAGAGRDRADLPGTPRHRCRTRDRPRDGRGLSRHPRPHPAPPACRRHRRARRGASGDRTGRERVASPDARSPAGRTRTRARRADRRRCLQLRTARRRLVDGASDHSCRRTRSRAGTSPGRLGRAEVGARRAGPGRGRAGSVVPQHLADRRRRLCVARTRRPLQVVGSVVGHRRAAVAPDPRWRPSRGRAARRTGAARRRAGELSRAGAECLQGCRGPAFVAAHPGGPGRCAGEGGGFGPARNGAVGLALSQRAGQPARPVGCAAQRIEQSAAGAAGAFGAIPVDRGAGEGAGWRLGSGAHAREFVRRRIAFQMRIILI
ncbi:hypothetical protein VARIO8X_80022 [Burkholderiales bacterium 8X]|nr:hypothetical protein VARIO8X_80022 [Burkholderiales bacterium 8X]